MRSKNKRLSPKTLQKVAALSWQDNHCNNPTAPMLTLNHTASIPFLQVWESLSRSPLDFNTALYWRGQNHIHHDQDHTDLWTWTSWRSMRVVAIERLKRLQLWLGSRLSHPLDRLIIITMMMMIMMTKMIVMMTMMMMMMMMTTCHEVTSQTSSMAVIVSRNSSKPSLWCGVVNLDT